MALLGFLGMGNMGYAMLSGALNRFNQRDFHYTDINKERLEYVKKETGISYMESNSTVVEQSKYVVLAIKPQYYSVVLKDIKDYITKEHIIISIAPGKTIESLKDILGQDIRILRAMPNTPALVNEGMSGICYSGDEYSQEERDVIAKLFSSFGRFEEVEESLMDAVVCATGSSPAYVYMFIEALADSAVKYGLSRDKAYKMVAQTVLGSAKMVLETGKHPGELKDQVCSPGGTTIAGVAALEENGMRNSIMKATDACYQKALDLKN